MLTNVRHRGSVGFYQALVMEWWKDVPFRPPVPKKEITATEHLAPGAGPAAGD